jgi:RNA polymerase subunit RPABC4/transcription elongation factor Spt4
MNLASEDAFHYLANAVRIAYADGTLNPKEEAALEEIRVRIGAKKGDLKKATQLIEAGNTEFWTAPNLATRFVNLEDMIYLSLVDGKLAEQESKLIADFCCSMSITQEQLDIMVKQVQDRATAATLQIVCKNCGQTTPSSARFCPHCGYEVAASSDEGTSVTYEIPKSGYAIEFCESTAAGFPSALDAAKRAPVFQSALRNKKQWFVAGWPASDFAAVVELAQELSGIRNRKLFQDGQEVEWNDVFGFVWCAGQRETAYRPVEYCFGRDENRINPWGCKQARFEWTEWAQWFSYGQFGKSGVMRTQNVWIFDKERIRHELNANLHQFRFCPHLRPKLVEAVLNALLDKVVVSLKDGWKHSQTFQEVPGCIKVVEIQKSGDFEYKNEFFADGVRPVGLDVLRQVLNAAFADAGVQDITVNQVVK